MSVTKDANSKCRIAQRKTAYIKGKLTALLSDAQFEVSAAMPDAHGFMSLTCAGEKLDAGLGDYNEIRPHSAIGKNVPVALKYSDGAASPPS